MPCSRLLSCLISGLGALVILTAGPANSAGGSGERLFNQYCLSCHTVERNVNRVGPSLYHVVGRHAGAGPSSYSYSAAFQNADFIWTEAMLDAYLADPGRLIANTRMAFRGLDDADTRAAIIDYLKNH